MFFEHTSAKVILFFILYGITGLLPFLAAIYLLLRRGNAIAPDVTPPLRLRRWTASFFAVSTLAHVWWLLFYFYSGDQDSVAYLVLVMLDSVLLFTTFAGTLLAMLQDRRRSVWPALMAMIPFALIAALFMVYPQNLIEKIASIYLFLLSLLFTAYMVFAIRQYGRWLNDNYADLENKKVWLCQAVSLVCMLLFVIYVLATDMVLIWLIHVIELVLIGLLLWRVETLPDLGNYPQETHPQPLPVREGNIYNNCGEAIVDVTTPLPTAGGAEAGASDIEVLLAERCVATQLYLQHELTLQHLAQAIGTNRSYLSQYFSRQGITYNIYINNLRINHFISLYQEVAGTQQSFTVQQLASESGYRSYSTFSLAFKQRTGVTVTAWMQSRSRFPA